MPRRLSRRRFLRTTTRAAAACMVIPEGLAFGPQGNLFVASFTNDYVIEYDATTGAYARTISGGGPGRAAWPAVQP